MVVLAIRRTCMLDMKSGVVDPYFIFSLAVAGALGGVVAR
jgi:hypothetical protein